MKGIRASKETRHAKIKDILENKVILTQKELLDELLRQGIKATQATVSRDIKELY
jgi:transcriptional regulator of arginine metabolism